MSSIRNNRPPLQSHFNHHSTSLCFLLNLTLRPILFQFPQYRQSLLLYLFSRIFVKNPNHRHFMVTLWLLVLIIGRNCDRNSVFAVFFLERVIETGFFIVNFFCFLGIPSKWHPFFRFTFFISFLNRNLFCDNWHY